MAVVGAAASGAGRGPRSDAFDAAVAAACATLSALIVRPMLAGLPTGRQMVLAGLLTVHGPLSPSGGEHRREHLRCARRPAWRR
ncbi:MAG: hypothetical protein ABJC62_04110 [Frankiaceae bacterium]